MWLLVCVCVCVCVIIFLSFEGLNIINFPFPVKFHVIVSGKVLTPGVDHPYTEYNVHCDINLLYNTCLSV